MEQGGKRTRQVDVREEERVDKDGGDEGSLPRNLNGGDGGVEGGALSIDGEGYGANGSDCGEEGEG